MAEESMAAVRGTSPGISPFIQIVEIQARNLESVTSVEFEIQAKSGALSKPVHVTESHDWLARLGYVPGTDGTLKVRVFGLYGNYANAVTLNVEFADHSRQQLPFTLTTVAYQDPRAVYDKLVVLTRRASGTTLGFNFFYLKSGVGEPVVVDTDGEIRWVGDPSVTSTSATSIFTGGRFVAGDDTTTGIRYIELDGSMSNGQLASTAYTDFHHNIDPGKSGLLAEFDALEAGVPYVETDIAEITLSGQVIEDWDLGQIISNYMQSQGDDPTLFVRPGTDWFHMNASFYDPLDDSVVVSSRENFVIKLDYSTKQIK